MCLVVLFVRLSRRLATPDLWAEDGSLFFEEAQTLGWASVLRPYEGYFHTLPRVVMVLLNHTVPVEILPQAIVLVCSATTAACLAAVASPGLRWLIAPTWQRIALAVLLCFPAGAGESFGNLANIHWLLFVGAALTLLAAPGALSMRSLGLLVLMAATCGEAILLLPLATARTLAHHRRAGRWCRREVAALALVVASVLSTIALRFLSTGAGAPWTLAAMLDASLIADVFVGLIAPIVGWPRAHFLVASPLALMAAGCACASVWLLCVRAYDVERRVIVAGFAVAAFALPVLICVARGTDSVAFFEPATLSSLARYDVVVSSAGIALWGCAISTLARTSAMVSKLFASGLFAALVMGVFALPQGLLAPYSDTPAWQSAIRAGACTTEQPIPISPEGWQARCYRRPKTSF